MTKISYVLIFLFLLFIAKQLYTYEETDSVKLLYRLINEKSSVLEKRYKMRTIGDSVGMPGGIIQELGASFQIRNITSLDEARKIILDCGNEFLIAINTDEKLKPHLIKYPLTMENVRISIFPTDSDCDDQGDCLEVVRLSSGHIFYNYNKKDEIYGYTKKIEETYQEAVKKLHSN